MTKFNVYDKIRKMNDDALAAVEAAIDAIGKPDEAEAFKKAHDTIVKVERELRGAPPNLRGAWNSVRDNCYQLFRNVKNNKTHLSRKLYGSVSAQMRKSHFNAGKAINYLETAAKNKAAYQTKTE
jgi:hypothetical protein